MGRYASIKRIRLCPVLPDDLVRKIFSKLDFADKIHAGLVCKQWDRLLKTGTAAARHWVVDYNVDPIVASAACTSNNVNGPVAWKFAIIKRCVDSFVPLSTGKSAFALPPSLDRPSTANWSTSHIQTWQRYSLPLYPASLSLADMALWWGVGAMRNIIMGCTSTGFASSL
jgi:hypothetical protein